MNAAAPSKPASPAPKSTITHVAAFTSRPHSIRQRAGVERTGVGTEGAVIAFDGTQQTRVASGTQATLLDVNGVSEDHAWAVGFEGTLLRLSR